MHATVVVSCYNQEKYIGQCLESIVAQEVDFPYRVFVSDDCSTDRTAEIVESYRLRYPDLIEGCYRTENVGAARNYVEAHNSVDGDIIFHFDGDDLMLPGKLQKQFDVFRLFPDVNIVFHRSKYFSDDWGYLVDTGSPKGMVGDNFAFTGADLALWGTIAVHSSYAYRRSSRRFRDPNRVFMEWFFAMDSLLPSARGIYLNDVLTMYRSNNGSGYTGTKAGRRKSYLIYMSDIEYYFGLFPDLAARLVSNYAVTFLAMIRSGIFPPTSCFSFMLKNFWRLRPAFLAEALSMRVSVAPATRNR